MVPSELEAAVGAEVVGGKVAPTCGTSTVVDHDVGNDLNVLLVESRNDGFEIGGCAPAGVLVIPLTRVITYVVAANFGTAFALSRGWEPYAGERFGNFVDMIHELGPACLFLAIPVEALEHDVSATSHGCWVWSNVGGLVNGDGDGVSVAGESYDASAIFGLVGSKGDAEVDGTRATRCATEGYPVGGIGGNGGLPFGRGGEGYGGCGGCGFDVFG